MQFCICLLQKKLLQKQEKRSGAHQKIRETKTIRVGYKTGDHDLCFKAKKADEFLNAETLSAPKEYKHNARRFLYYQLFRASLPFNDFLETVPRPGFVQLQSFSWKQLLPEKSPTIKVLVEGIRNKKTFLLEEQ